MGCMVVAIFAIRKSAWGLALEMAMQQLPVKEPRL